MTFHQTLTGLFMTAALGACATQVDDEHTFNGDPDALAGSGGAAASSGSGGSTAPGKGGTTSTSGGKSSGGSTSTGKGGTTGSGGTAQGGSGGDTETGGTTSSGGGGTGGSAGSTSSGGTGTVTSCEGLPEWIAGAAPPDPPMTSGDELGFNGKKWTYVGSGSLWNFEGGCPPETTQAVMRQGWCDGSAQNQYTLVGPCE